MSPDDRSRARVFYALAVVGFFATWYFNASYLLQGGSLLPAAFFGSAFANALTTAITVDVYLSAVVYALWVYFERDRGPKPWLYIAICFCVGLAIAFPLYLARRFAGSRRWF